MRKDPVSSESLVRVSSSTWKAPVRKPAIRVQSPFPFGNRSHEIAANRLSRICTGTRRFTHALLPALYRGKRNRRDGYLPSLRDMPRLERSCEGDAESTARRDCGPLRHAG